MELNAWLDSLEFEVAWKMAFSEIPLALTSDATNVRLRKPIAKRVGAAYWLELREPADGIRLIAVELSKDARPTTFSLRCWFYAGAARALSELADAGEFRLFERSAVTYRDQSPPASWKFQLDREGVQVIGLRYNLQVDESRLQPVALAETLQQVAQCFCTFVLAAVQSSSESAMGIAPAIDQGSPAQVKPTESAFLIERAATLDKSQCDIWLEDGWHTVPVSIAMASASTLVRCPACYGPIGLFRESHNGRNRAHMEHKPEHLGCRLAHYYDGHDRPNPSIVASPPLGNEPTEASIRLNSDDETLIGDVDSTQRQRLTNARVGQGIYRERVRRLWGSCSVSDCTEVTLLVASHIMPWRACETNAQRLDAFNGLFLAPNLDRLFDRGLISFDSDGKIILSSHLSAETRSALHVHETMRMRFVPPGVRPYLAKHRNEFFHG